MNIFDQLDELERDVDLALDEERDRVGFAGSGFCPSCGYLIEAHWHTDLAGTRQWFSCPHENEVRYLWGDR